MREKANSVVAKLIEMGYESSVAEVQKNNGVVKIGVTVKVKGNSVAPNVYFGEDESVDDIVERCIREVKRTPKLEDDWFNWDTVKNALTLSLVNYDRNKDSDICIKQIPGTDMGIIVRFLVLENSEIGRGFITIKPSHLEVLGISEDVLFAVAEDRFQTENDYKITSLIETLIGFGMPLDVGITLDLGMPPVDVVTNGNSTNGAVAMLNKNCQRELSEKFGGNFYIVPSSIHEFLVMPFNEDVRNGMSGMIAEVNETKVLPEEQLSDNLFYYDAEEDCIKVA